MTTIDGIVFRVSRLASRDAARKPRAKNSTVTIVIESAIRSADVSISICIVALPRGRDKISISRCPASFPGNKGNRLTSDTALLPACLL